MCYFAIAFGAGFVLGALRETLITPRVGKGIGVVLELPLMLSVSALAARWIVRRWKLDRVGAGLKVGVVAFVLLLTAEAGLAWVGRGQPPTAFLAGLIDPVELLGLSAQLVFGLMPAIWIAWTNRRSRSIAR